jgi:hypothetical protein
MGIQIGNVTGTAAYGVTFNGKQLSCPTCGNTDRWGDITMTNNRTIADCDVCGEQVKA